MDKSLLARLAGRHEFYLGLLVLLLAIGLSAGTDEFLTLGNLTDVATSYAILGILACGLFVVLIAGGIDISFPAVTAIAQYVMASWVIQHGGSFPLAFALAIGVGLLLGLVNGFLVYWLKVPAIIITIATLNLFYGLLVYATNGTWLYGFPDWFMNGINWFSFQGADGYDYGLTLPLLCLLATIVVTGVLMNRTRLGRQIYAMGGNRDAASRLGLNLLRLHFCVYGYMGILAGVAAVGDNPALAEQLGFLQNAVGGILDPFSSFLTLRGIRTLALRMQRHSDSALRIAQWLESQPQVENVYYPGLPSHPQHALAARQMTRFGGMISVRLKGDDAYARRVIKRSRLFTLAESLGGVESLISQPFSMTHASIPLEQRLATGITPQLVRLSVGIEDVEDLIADLQQALAE